jgi:nucleotide-binding universal stress UspA family protein
MAGRPPLGLWNAKLTDPHRISPDPGQCATVFRPINQTRDNETQELTMVKTILVPTDGSKHARSAVSLAADLAEKYNAKLIALHVMAQPGTEHIPEELRQYARAEHIEATDREMLESVGNQILRGAGVLAREEGAEQVETLLEIGDPAATVLEVAKSQNVDLIVMGNRGLGSLQGLLQGSVSHKVNALSSCSCVTVK